MFLCSATDGENLKIYKIQTEGREPENLHLS